jgi:hypothetical protein
MRRQQTISELLNDLNSISPSSEYRIAEHIHRERIGVTSALVCLVRGDKILSPADLASQHLVITPPPLRHSPVIQWFRRPGTRSTSTASK